MTREHLGAVAFAMTGNHERVRQIEAHRIKFKKMGPRTRSAPEIDIVGAGKEEDKPQVRHQNALEAQTYQNGPAWDTGIQEYVSIRRKAGCAVTNMLAFCAVGLEPKKSPLFLDAQRGNEISLLHSGGELAKTDEQARMPKALINGRCVRIGVATAYAHSTAASGSTAGFMGFWAYGAGLHACV